MPSVGCAFAQRSSVYRFKQVVLFTPASASSLLAFVTTIHLGLAALRNHRRLSSGPIGSLAAVSLLLAGLPWIFPSAIGVVLGLAVHGAWFAICERTVPRQGVVMPTPPGRAGPVEDARVRPRGFSSVPVLAVVEETASIKTIRFARPEGFVFEPGQFVTVRIRVDGKDLARCYSISSAPEASGYLDISVRRQGTVSNALHATMRPGAMLSMKGPVGVFKYPGGDDRPIVLLAGGIGITPLMCMLRHALSVAPTRPVTLLYSARSEEDFAFKDELTVAARRHPQLRVQFAVSSGRAGPHVYPGRIDEALIRATVPNVADSVCLICGPTPMIESTRAWLLALHVPPAQIRHEVFNAAIAASSHEPESVVTAPTARPAAVPRAAAVHYRMACDPGGRSVPIVAGQTLLEAAEEADVPIMSLCRAGVCGTCRIRVTSGDVTCESDTLDPRDREQGFVLACVSTTRGDCAVAR